MTAGLIHQVLSDYGHGMTERDVARILKDVLVAVPDASATQLPDGDRDLLVSMSGISTEDQPALAAELADASSLGRAQRDAAVAAEASFAATLLSYLQVAELLGVHPSSVTRAVASGRLYAVTVDGQRRFPSWQFSAGRVLPGLKQVLIAVPNGLSPHSLAVIMTTPDDDLDHTSPSQWLSGGGDADRVTGLLETLDRW